jgi:hypothetical protein
MDSLEIVAGLGDTLFHHVFSNDLTLHFRSDHVGFVDFGPVLDLLAFGWTITGFFTEGVTANGCASKSVNLLLKCPVDVLVESSSIMFRDLGIFERVGNLDHLYEGLAS